MATKKKSKVKELADSIQNPKRSLSQLKWEHCDGWTTDHYLAHFRDVMYYYRTNYSGKDLKPAILMWMAANSYSKQDIAIYKNGKDWRTNLTMGAIASCLNNGMLDEREDFNNGKSTVAWLKSAIARVLEESVDDHDEEAVQEKASTPQPTIQDRIRESSLKMTDDIEDALDNFSRDPEAFDPKAIKVINLLKSKEAKAAHARVIRDFYVHGLNELDDLEQGQDEQLKEGYSHLSKSQIKKLHTFYKEIVDACGMLMQESKVNRAPRAKKAQPKEKIVAKLKYLKTHEQLKLVSINPTDIIGSQELWVYNTKTRKVGKYVAAEFSELSVKGTGIINFDESSSVQKTLRKPEEQLKEFKDSGKVQLRKFLEDIKAVDIKLNGRINEDTILLKVQ